MTRIAILVALLLTSSAVLAQQSGTFTETYPVTTDTTVNGTVSCSLDTTRTILTCTFSQALKPSASVIVNIPAGL